MSDDKDKATGNDYSNLFREQVEATKLENEKARLEAEKERLRQARSLEDARVALKKVFEEVRSVAGLNVYVTDIDDDSTEIRWEIKGNLEDTPNKYIWTGAKYWFFCHNMLDDDTSGSGFEGNSYNFSSSSQQLDDLIKATIEAMGKIVGNYLSDKGGNK
mgnify:CR=1 FL=1